MKTDHEILLGTQNRPIINVYRSRVRPHKRIYREHYHTECELSLVANGSGKYIVGEREYAFSAGDVFLFGGNEMHFITDIYSDLDLLNIHFEPSLLWEHPDGNMLLSLFFARNQAFSNRFSNESALAEKILCMERELCEKKLGYETECKHLLFSALIYILRRYDHFDKAEYTNNYRQTAQKLKQVLLYIDEHLEQRLCLATLARIACMSKTYFSTVFKKFNGISPWDYIAIKRVEKAIRLLKTSNANKIEIAEACGFSSSSNFYKMFFKVTGKAPSDYVEPAIKVPK